MANPDRRDRWKLKKGFDQWRMVVTVNDIWDNGQGGQIRHHFYALIADFMRNRP